MYETLCYKPHFTGEHWVGDRYQTWSRFNQQLAGGLVLKRTIIKSVCVIKELVSVSLRITGLHSAHSCTTFVAFYHVSDTQIHFRGPQRKWHQNHTLASFRNERTEKKCVKTSNMTSLHWTHSAGVPLEWELWLTLKKRAWRRSTCKK